MCIGAELEQYILQTHNSNKIMKIQWGFEPPSPPPPLGTPVVWLLIVDSYVVNEVFLLCIQPYLQHNDLSLKWYINMIAYSQIHGRLAYSETLTHSTSASSKYDSRVSNIAYMWAEKHAAML